MMAAVILLVETAEGAAVAVRFADGEAARDWEDAHTTEVTGLGLAPIVTRTEALRLAAR